MRKIRTLGALLILLSVQIVRGQIVFGDEDTSDDDVARTTDSCTITDGPGGSLGIPCLLPFIYEGVKYEGCITISDPEDKPWCSTKVDVDGVHVVGGGHWGHCDTKFCPIADNQPNGNEDEDGSLEIPQTLEVFRICTTNIGTSGQCKPASLCVGLTPESEVANECELDEADPDLGIGVCCEERTKNENTPNFAPKEDNTQVRLSSDVNVAGFDDILETKILSKGIGERFGDAPGTGELELKPISDNELEEKDDGDPTDFHLRFQQPLDGALSIDNTAVTFTDAAFAFQTDNGLNDTEVSIGLRSLLNSDVSPRINRACPWTPAPECHSVRYRSADGTCNNFKEPNYGRAITPYQRILLPEYSGKLFLPRRSKDGRTELPSARLLSSSLTQEPNVVDSIHTVLLMQMGQFVDHDITHTPTHSKKCCTSDNAFPGSFDPDKCFPIPISESDPVWRGAKTCMSLARSLASPGLKCGIEFRQQMNQITHWLDASNIYGSSEGATHSLRSFSKGQMRITRQTATRVGVLPSCSNRKNNPQNIGMCRGCSSCFFAGDGRANEQLNLLVMHTVWMREHNRVARALEKLNFNWDDEKLFQEARRIVTAEYQHIVYKEWLPVVLGKEFMDIFGLWPLSKGYSTSYMDHFDPRITNEFATAAFRFGHSLIPKEFKRIRRTRLGRGFEEKLKMSSLFFKPSEMRRNAGLLDDLVRGMVNQEGEVWDNAFADDIQNHLFEPDNNEHGGLDLVALNIQRGRDHGLQGYNAYREICQSGSGRVRDWAGLEDLIQPSMVSKLRTIYKDVDDVDLFVGGFLETPHRDSLLGPTFKCIIGDQFARLKYGDRFFYDLGNDEITKFTPEQLQEIRKTSMARVICDNTDTLSSIQPQVFRTAGSSRSNSQVRCNSVNIPSMNMNVFRDSGKR